MAYISSVTDYIPEGLVINNIVYFLLHYLIHKWQGPKGILSLQDFLNICVPFCTKTAN